MDAPHALFQTNGIPRYVVVDHEPAELEVDTFAGGLGRDEDLSIFAELALGVDARAWRVAVANLHSAVDLGDGQVPLAEFADQIIERILVLGENEELELGVLENALISEQLLQLHQLGLDFALF